MNLNITPGRSLNLLYIILDSIFVIFYVCFLFYKKRKDAAIIGLIFGVVYYIVDYVFFYHVSRSRVVIFNGEYASELGYAMYLLWHELSSGITNFSLLWLCISKDKDLKLWLILVIGWWLICPAISELGGSRNIVTYRTTTAYHGPMAIILAIGYFALIIYDFMVPKEKRVNILWLNLIGIGVQFAWEGAFLLYGIREWNSASIPTLLIDSLIETNLGMPYLYVIYRYYLKKKEEHSKKKNKVVNLQSNNDKGAVQ